MLLDYVRERVWQNNKNVALISFVVGDPDLCLSFIVLKYWNITYQSAFAKTLYFKNVFWKQLTVQHPTYE